MAEKGRIDHALRNSAVSLVCCLFTMIAHLLFRRSLAQYLGAADVGALKIFNDITGLLSIADMGLYGVFAQALYKPVADGNKEIQKAYLSYFQKIFRIVFLFILLAGAGFVALLPLIFPSLQSMPNARLALSLMVIASAMPYLTMHVQALLLAKQQIRIFQILRCLCDVLTVGLQIFLLQKGNGLAACCAASAIFSVVFSASLLPFSLKGKGSLPISDKKNLTRNMLAGILHKVGSVVYSFTDSFVITWVSGFAATGYYDSTSTLYAAAARMGNSLLDGFTGTIGNICAMENREYAKRVFLAYQRMTCAMAGLINGILFCLVAPFVALWLGEEYVLSVPILLAMAIQYYLQLARKPIWSFKDAFGLWWQDRFKPLAEAFVNLILSLVLARYLGILGVVLGTIFSVTGIAMSTEIYVLARYGLICRIRDILIPFLIHSAWSVFAAGIAWFTGQQFGGEGWIALMLRGVVCTVVITAILAAWHCPSKDFQMILRLVKTHLKKQK